MTFVRFVKKIKTITLLKLSGILGLFTLSFAHATTPPPYSPQEWETLVQQLDPHRPELQPVTEKSRSGDWQAASQLLLDLYAHKTPPARSWIQDPVMDPENKPEALLEGKITLQGLSGKIIRLPNGSIDWLDRGPKGDREWALFLNRHLYFLSLFNGYRTTGKRVYAAQFENMIQDWIFSNPVGSRTNTDVRWRTMEVARRLTDSWPHTFYGFVGSPHVSRDAKLRMLGMIPIHAQVCLDHATESGNHLLVEMLALAQTARDFPEFQKAPQWWNRARGTVEREMERQVYPSGAQMELSNHYQKSNLITLERITSCSKNLNPPLSPAFLQKLEKMWDYFARLTGPNGNGPLNNDADQESNARWISRAADAYQRSEWKGIATQGAEGVLPSGNPSSFFPWAGHALLRSGWDRNALASFFDASPAGLAHQHRDKLNLTVWAWGREFLCDAGRYHYQPDDWRRYFTGSAAHNVLRLNGKDQRFEPFTVTSPLSARVGLSPEIDAVQAEVRFEEFPLTTTHRRMIVRFQNQWILVLDSVKTFEPVTIQALWHGLPDLEADPNGQFRDPRTGNRLTITPIGTVPWKPKIIRGQIHPEIQGWHSPAYNQKQPSPVFSYESKIQAPSTFAWLLSPLDSKSATPTVTLQKNDAVQFQVVIQKPGFSPATLFIPHDAAHSLEKPIALWVEQDRKRRALMLTPNSP